MVNYAQGTLMDDEVLISGVWFSFLLCYLLSKLSFSLMDDEVLL